MNPGFPLDRLHVGTAPLGSGLTPYALGRMPSAHAPPSSWWSPWYGPASHRASPRPPPPVALPAHPLGLRVPVPPAVPVGPSTDAERGRCPISHPLPTCA